MRLSLFLFLSFCFSTFVQAQWERKQFSVDVVINFQTAFVNGEFKEYTPQGGTPIYVPAGGNNYVIAEGLIYPGNYLKDVLSDVNGGIELDTISGLYVAKDSGDVIGTWDCMGWFVEDIAVIYQEEGGIFDFSTQKFSFHKGISGLFEGTGTIVSDGSVEYAFNVPHERSVNGGYQFFRGTLGSVVLESIGTNATNGSNFTATFDVMVRK